MRDDVAIWSARVRRNVEATIKIAALGAFGGALGGVLLAAIVVLTEFGRPGSYLAYRFTFDMVAIAASICGAATGAVLGPLFAWTLLRRAPLWRVVGETAFAAALGAGLVIVLVQNERWLVVGAATSALLAALRLRVEQHNALHRARAESRDTLQDHGPSMLLDR